VKKKITKEKFILNHNNLNDEKDFPREFLSDIYDRILAAPLKYCNEKESTTPQNCILTTEQRQVLFKKVFFYCFCSQISTLIYN
jgi:Sec7-like guanine-nucleotide exchange factor